MSFDPLFYKHLLDSLHDGVYFVDRDRRITYWNKGAERLSGYTAEQVIGSCCRDNLLMHVDSDGRALCVDFCRLAATIADGGDRHADVLMRHRDGHRVPVTIRTSPMRDPQGAIIGAVEVFSETPMRADLHRRMEELKAMAFADHLTEVPNRRYLETVLRSKIQEHAQHGLPLGLLFVDIDHFKRVNDRYGHEIGDRVLRMVAATLSANLRPLDIVGRWGGEEFLLILTNIAAERLFPVADRLRLLVEHSSVGVDDELVRVTISVGATIARRDEPWESLVERADELMYRSKSSGRNVVTAEL
jgi:diguanylate cyclase (GGDEF)-like protein/PAS domain S-box-containing protein